MNVSPSPANLDIETLFPFELDDFQKQAIAALNAGQSVVVCVPTGSGKTLVGEYAIYRALTRGNRVFYTTPLKALSNQKFRDFRRQFGEEQVGLLTGDASFNRDAPVLVMTTEIFRNMLYGTPIGQIGTSLENVTAVVLDECHYMNDSQRGTVWEESIIYCPPEIQLVALSATVANAAQLTEWISQVHASTVLIQSDFRPIPLEFHFSTLKGLFPLLNDNQTQLNPRLKIRKYKQNPKRRIRREDCPTLVQVTNQLQARAMLPAIYFIFSRRGCDQAVSQMGSVSLVNAAEAAELERRIKDFLSRNPKAERAGQLEPLHRGIAAHHAGILPAWKALVEELFQVGLVKVVFATETLAAGINMPARTTVLSAISKRTDRGHRLLTASEFLQMAGRAGRRGMDEIGYVVTVQTPFEGAKDAANLALKKADPLASRFTPNYGMVLNLLQTHGINEAKQLLERSFAQYVSALNLAPEQRAMADLTGELAKLNVELAPIKVQQFDRYEKLRERQREERRLLKTLQQQAEAARKVEIAALLPNLTPGEIVALKGKHVAVAEPLAAVLVEVIPGRGRSPYFVCLGVNNRWYVVAVADIVAVASSSLSASQLDGLAPPDNWTMKLGQYRKGDSHSKEVAHLLRDRDLSLDPPPEVLAQQQRLATVQAQLDNHPLKQWGKPGTLIKRHKRRLALQEDLKQRQSNYREHQTHHWKEFLNLIELLREFDALRDYSPTQLGQAAAAIRGDNELWLGLALTSGVLDDFDPHHLAAAVYVLISDPPRPDLWTNYRPPTAVIEELNQLRGLKRHLIQRQHRYKIALPVWLEDDTTELMGIVEQWALGVEWSDLCDNTNCDEGDLVRMLRRTVDFLSQIPHIPHIAESLPLNARRAMQLMERFPVAALMP